MEIRLSVSTPVGDSLDTDVVYKGCVVKIEDRELPAKLALLDMTDFDVILCMGWLAVYHASVDYF